MSDCNKIVITKKGEKGDNAFKFTKEFITNSTGTIITVTRAELVACGAVPIGCLGSATATSLTDLNIQVWVKNISLGKAYWEQCYVGTSTGTGIEEISWIRVDDTTGDITTELNSGHGNIKARIVVTG